MRPILQYLGVALLIVIANTSQSTASPDSVGVTSRQLTDHIYLLTSAVEQGEVNQTASIGPDGILLVDVGVIETAPQLRKKLDSLGNGRVRLIVNTHSHDDHAGGNRLFRDESIIVAHRNVPDELGGRYFALPPKPSQDAPTILIDDSLSLQFNGEQVRLIHWPNVHTNSDVIVHFTASKIVCIGDLAFPDHFPFIDLSIGGDVANYIADVKRLADLFPLESIFISGHGRTYTHQDLISYYDQLVQQREIVKLALASGKSVADLQKDSVLAKWKIWSGPWPTTVADYWIAALAQSLAPTTTTRKVSICSPFTETLVRDGVAAAIKRYHDLKVAQPPQYDFGENELNLLGYILMNRNRLDDAIQVLKLNTEIYPSSFNVFDSYGEVLVAVGDTLNAIKNYKKSLKLNPKNTNAVAVLKQLGTKK